MRTISFLLFCFILGCVSAQTRTEFFRNVRIDHRQHQFVARNKIDAEIAVKTNAYRVIFDEQNRITDIFYEERGRWAVGRNRISHVHIVYTDSVEKRFYNFPEEYQDKEEHNIRLVKLILNDDKVPVEIRNYCIDGKLTKDRQGVFAYRRILNEDGWMIESYFLDENGLRTTNNNGDYSRRYRWSQDDTHYRVELAFHDRAGRLHDGERGHSLVRMRFEKGRGGNMTEIQFRNTRRQRVLNERGFAMGRWTFENGLLKTANYFGTDGRRINRIFERFFRAEFEYNEFGNPIRTVFSRLHPNGGVVRAERTFIYDENQNLMYHNDRWMR